MNKDKIMAALTGEQPDNVTQVVDSPNQYLENSESVRRDGYKPQIPILDSSRLFGEEKEIMIRHEGTVYRIRITKNGKLVMNK